MKWTVIIAPGPVDESGSRLLVSNLPPETRPVFMGGDVMQLSTVQLKVEASTEAAAAALGLEIFNEAASSAGLSLQPKVRSVVKNPKG
jgi:hypothetical protein